MRIFTEILYCKQIIRGSSVRVNSVKLKLNISAISL